MPRVKKEKYLPNEKEVLVGMFSNLNGWKIPNELSVLKQHLKDGGKILDLEYFYSNIEKLAAFKYYHGLEVIYLFCRRSIKGRLPNDVEKTLFSNFIWKNWRSAKVGYKYARYVVRGKLEKDLRSGCKSLEYILYLMDEKKEFEDILLNNPELCYLFYIHKHYLPEIVHSSMMCQQMIGNAAAIKYFHRRKKEDEIIKNRLSVVDGSRTVREFLESI